MSSIGEIRELAKRLQLFNLARGDIDLSGSSKANLAYLQSIFEQEVALREKSHFVKLEHDSRLPRKEFLPEKLNGGVRWQIEQLEKLAWIDDEQNLFIIGKCGVGKTALASHLGRLAMKANIKVSYNTIDTFLYTLRNKERSNKQALRYKHWLTCSLIIIDDMMYTGLTDEELMDFYHAAILLNETRSIVIVTSRELSEWLRNGDVHLMRTLIDCLSGNSQLLRLM